MKGKSMQELSEWDELKTFFDRRLIKALGHPVREHILAVLNERVASASEIGEELGADVSSFYHHIEELEKLDCIERVETRKRRGANEHFFRAKRTVFFDNAAWRRLPASLKEDLRTTFVQAMFDHATTALERGPLSRHGDEHVSWTPTDLDEAGWDDVTNLMDQTLARLAAIQRESSGRLASNGGKRLSAAVGILAFETNVSAGESSARTARLPEQIQRQASAQ
ncbi:MAG: hypothetical protein QOF13_1251 [Solirubrobacterales bacterium]|jgi:DNA-binding transcriptional ArsR family regulator|nr:hypothetical protein [Solirubrobacterales bacterium]